MNIDPSCPRCLDTGTRLVEGPCDAAPLDVPCECALHVMLRGWVLALRDLCEQGATHATVTLPGASGAVTLAYRAGEGARVVAAGRVLTIPDEALDAHGLVVA